jgi:hypothetical protein
MLTDCGKSLIPRQRDNEITGSDVVGYELLPLTRSVLDVHEFQKVLTGRSSQLRAVFGVTTPVWNEALELGLDEIAREMRGD